MKTITEFIAEHGVTMTATPVPANPYTDSMPNGSLHFHVILEKSGGRPMTTYFSVGPGIVENWVAEHGKRKFGVVGGLTREEYKRLRYRRTIAVEAFYNANKANYRPDLASVLDCLASDSVSVENSPVFEDWADEFGYDTDSRKAEKTFQACCEQARTLRALLGPATFDILLYETERE